MSSTGVSLNIVETLKTCITAALCSQRYILNDVLRIQEALGNPLEEEDRDSEQRVSNPSITFSPDTPVSSSEGGGGDSLSPLLEDSQHLQGSMQLTEQQQSRLRRSICHSLDVASKGELEHRATSTTDLVTSADVMVQHVVEAFLNADFGRGNEQPSNVKPWLPFTVVGEEEEDEATEVSEDVTIRNANAVSGSFRYRVALTDQEAQLIGSLDAHMETHKWGAKDFEITDKSWDALRPRVAIFIDPIDGTNAFVEGELHVPMTLIGIAVDGVPIAGVVNRVFLTDGSGAMNTGSLSIACRSLRSIHSHSLPPSSEPIPQPFVVLSGTVVEDVSSLTTASSSRGVGASIDASERVLAVTYSASTKASILDPALQKLAPRSDVPARGAGYKIMMVVDGISVGGASQGTTADLFVSPNAAIKKWDSCAPHAILAALGGTATDMFGTPITYRVVVAEDGGDMCRKETISLRNGFVGMSGDAVHSVVTSRFGW